MAPKASGVTGVITKTYDVIEELPNGGRLVLCDVSWNDGEPRTELRIIRNNGHFGSGIPITKKGLKKLTKYLSELDEPSPKKKEKEEVDFSKIFESGSSVSKARSSGYTTKDGRISLYRKR